MQDGIPTSENMMPKALCSSEAVGLANSPEEALRFPSLLGWLFQLLAILSPFSGDCIRGSKQPGDTHTLRLSKINGHPILKTYKFDIQQKQLEVSS